MPREIIKRRTDPVQWTRAQKIALDEADRVERAAKVAARNEMPAHRTENKKVFVNPDGSVTQAFTQRPQHWRASIEDEWEDFDPRWVTTPSEIRLEGMPFEITLPNKVGMDIQYRDKKTGQTLRMEHECNVAPFVDRNTVRWVNGLANVDFELGYTRKGVVVRALRKNHRASLVFRYTVTDPDDLLSSGPRPSRGTLASIGRPEIISEVVEPQPDGSKLVTITTTNRVVKVADSGTRRRHFADAEPSDFPLVVV